MNTFDTLLLVLPKDDTALSDEPGGGQVPQAWRWILPIEPPAWQVGIPAAWVNPHAIERALLLVHEGRPVPMACDRAARRSDQPLRQAYLSTDAEDIAMIYVRHHPGARVIRLRGGVEVAGE